MGITSNLSERGNDLLPKRGSHAIELSISKLSPFDSDHLSLDFKKKVLKQQLIDHENSVYKKQMEYSQKLNA